MVFFAIIFIKPYRKQACFNFFYFANHQGVPMISQTHSLSALRLIPRIVVPFAYWVGGRPSAPPTGSNITTTVYSDDDGRTWRQSPAKLTAPCYEGYNGSNYGACEPTILELADGRVWMLIRTQTGRLYESFSPDGAEWSQPEPSRFCSSNSPGWLLRLPDRRIQR